MRNLLQLLLATYAFTAFQANAQSFDLQKYNQEKELILNVVINSLQFDSVYTSKKVYFVANELLSEETPLVLKKGKCEVKIIQREKLKEKEYVALGDFTMARVDPTHVRVQITAMPQESLLNLRLEKKNGDWVIVNHLIMKE